MMNIIWCQHQDAAMSMFGVVPREERSAVARRVVDVVEPTREAGVVLQGLELCLRNGLSSETFRPREWEEAIGGYLMEA